MDRSLNLVRNLGVGEISEGIAIRTALERHDAKAGVGEFLRHNGTRPSHSYYDGINARFHYRHRVSLASRPDRRAAKDTADRVLPPSRHRRRGHGGTRSF